MSDIQIILPKRADPTKALDHALVTLTEAIHQTDPDLVAHGVLGGAFGYGAHYENDVFAMRPQYWGDCDCGDDERHKPTCSLELPNFLHKQSGLEVRWYKWIGRDMEAKIPEGADLQTIFSECLASLTPPPAAAQGE